MNYRFNISSPLIFVFWTATCTPATNEPTSQSSMGASNGRTTWRDGSRGKIPRAILWHVKDVVSQYQVADWGDQCSASSLFLGRSNISSLLPFLRRGVILLILIWFEDLCSRRRRRRRHDAGQTLLRLFQIPRFSSSEKHWIYLCHSMMVVEYPTHRPNVGLIWKYFATFYWVDSLLIRSSR